MDNYYKNLSSRRQRALENLIDELGLIRSIQESATPEFPALLASIQHYEQLAATRFPALPQSALQTNFFDKREEFVREWSDAFLETIAEWQMEVTDYASAVSKYENFRQSSPTADAELYKAINKEKSLAGIINLLAEAGFDAAALGSAEAHLQLRRIAQLFFARYSAEVSEPTAEALTYKPHSTAPRPNLAAFMNKRIRRASLMKQTGSSPDAWNIDNSVFLALYLDRITDGQGDIVSWEKTRELYHNQDLLVPGLPEIDDMLLSTKGPNDNLTDAYYRIQDQPIAWQDLASQSMVNTHKLGQFYRIMAEFSAQKELLELRLKPTLCLTHMSKGYIHSSYYGREDFWLLSSLTRLINLPIIQDLYSEGEIRCAWEPRLIEWKRQDKKATHETAVQNKMAELAKVRPAEPVGLPPELTAAQRERAAKTELRKAAEALVRRDELAKDKAAKEKAKKTKAQNRIKKAADAARRKAKLRALKDAIRAALDGPNKPKAPQEKRVPGKRRGPKKIPAWQEAENARRVVVIKETRAARKPKPPQPS